VTLKVKYADFHQITRSHTGAAPVTTHAEFEQVSFALLGPVFPVQKGIRLLGVTMSSLGESQVKADGQLNLNIY
jgi:DNA polymerase-4